MTEQQLAKYIIDFVKLNPTKKQKLNIDKYNQNSFIVIQSILQENIEHIINSNYDGIFHSYYKKCIGQVWMEILLNSKNIFEYNKKIKDKFPYCKQRKLSKILSDDLFYWFDKNTQNVIIELSQSSFDIGTKNKLEKIRFALDKKDWSVFFFLIQTLMHEYIIKFLLWQNKPLNFKDYSNVFFKKMMIFLELERVNKYLQFIQKVNHYRNTLSKVSTINQNNFDDWEKKNFFSKQSLAKEIYYDLLEFIDIINLIF